MNMVDHRDNACVNVVAACLLCGIFASTAGFGQSPSTAPATAPATQPFAKTWLRVTGDRVNVRSRPDVNSTIVARVSKDDLLQATGRDQYGWYEVIPPIGAFSFVHSKFIKRDEQYQGTVDTQGGLLRVRVGSMVRTLDPWSSEVQTRLESGDRVHVLGTQGEWLKILPPRDVRLYISGDYVAPVSDAIAQQFRRAATQPATAPANPVATTQPVTPPPGGPDMSGPWGQKLATIEKDIRAEANKPLLEQDWADIVDRLSPVAEQLSEPTIARLARAWNMQLRQRMAEIAVARQTDDILRRAARERAQHEREMKRIERLRRRSAGGRAYDTEGELLASDAVQPKDGVRWYKLQDPISGRLIGYIEVHADANVDAEPLLGKYVGVVGRRRFELSFGAPVFVAEAIEAVTPAESSDADTREAP